MDSKYCFPVRPQGDMVLAAFYPNLGGIKADLRKIKSAGDPSANDLAFVSSCFQHFGKHRPLRVRVVPLVYEGEGEGESEMREARVFEAEMPNGVREVWSISRDIRAPLWRGYNNIDIQIHAGRGPMAVPPQ